MNEDIQPNERPLHRKGGTVPRISSTQDRGRPTFQHGGRIHTPSRYHYRKTVSTSPSANRCPFSSRHIPHNPLLKRRQDQTYGSASKRRRIDHLSAAAQLPTLPEASSSVPKPSTWNVAFEPVELLIDMPLNCRRGAPNRKATSKKWLDTQTQTLSIKTGVSLRFGGYLDECARFVVDDTRPPVIDSGSNTQDGMTAQSPTDPLHPPNPGITWDSNVNNEIIIAENIDDLENPCEFLSRKAAIGTPNVLSYIHGMPPNPSEPYPSAPAIEPLRVFSSGVLFLSGTSPSPEALCLDTPLASNPKPVSHEGRTSKGIRAYSDASGNTPPPLQYLPDSFIDVQTSTPVDQDTSISMAHSDTLSSWSSHIHGNLLPKYRLANENLSAQLPLPQSDRARRIFPSGSTSVVAISMRGSIDQVDISPIRHQRTLRIPTPRGEQIDDASLLSVGDEIVTIFGHSRDHDQVTWCRFHGSSINQPVESRPLNRPWKSGKKGGVSAVASMNQPLQFATGGYDHIVHLWEVTSDLSSASPRKLAIKHTSQVQSLLAIQDTSHKLVSAGADCNVHIWDLPSERIVNTLKTSNAVYHVHTTTSPFCSLLEVAHRELQFEVRDHRIIPEYPVQRFGYTSDKVHGRFIKGDTWSHLFACGSRDGSVRLWDLRNVQALPATIASDQSHKVVQVIFKHPHLVICSESGQLRIFDYVGEH